MQEPLQPMKQCLLSTCDAFLETHGLWNLDSCPGGHAGGQCPGQVLETMDAMTACKRFLYSTAHRRRLHGIDGQLERQDDLSMFSVHGIAHFIPYASNTRVLPLSNQSHASQGVSTCVTDAMNCVSITPRTCCTHSTWSHGQRPTCIRDIGMCIGCRKLTTAMSLHGSGVITAPMPGLLLRFFMLRPFCQAVHVAAETPEPGEWGEEDVSRSTIRTHSIVSVCGCGHVSQQY